MDSSGRITLRQAADLIRAGKRTQAQPLLVEFLRDEPNNAQAWFLLSHALTDPKRQQYAVLQALRADPTFERARNRLITLQGGTPPAAKAAAPPPKFDPVPPPTPKPAATPLPKTQPVFEQPAPAPKPGTAFFDNEEPQPEVTQELRTESTFEETQDPRPRRSFRGLFIGIILFALLAAAVYFGRDLLAVGITITNPTSTQVPAFSTLPPTWTTTATDEPATLTPSPLPTSTPAPSETPGQTEASTLQ